MIWKTDLLLILRALCYHSSFHLTRTEYFSIPHRTWCENFSIQHRTTYRFRPVKINWYYIIILWVLVIFFFTREQDRFAHVK